MNGDQGRAVQALAQKVKVAGPTQVVESARAALYRLRFQDRGAAMAEYGLLLVLVGLAAFFTLQIFGGTLLDLFESSGEVMGDAAGDDAAGE